MKKINITCDTCSTTHKVSSTPEIPSSVISMGCNWCPICEDRANDYYDEWYNYPDGGDNSPDDIPDNQLCLPFVYNEIMNSEFEPNEIRVLENSKK